MKLCVLTSGGDCAGLNACLRSIVLYAKKNYGWDVVGSCDGLSGLINESFYNFDPLPSLSDGGSILGSLNKGDPKKIISESITAFYKHKFDALINIGGDGSCKIMQELYHQGQVPLIVVPKTIDNDLGGTDWSIGHMTSLQIVVDAIDRLATTAKTHRRVFILEVMGRGAGHIALHAGVAGGVDAILIPERSYELEKLVQHLHSKHHALIIVAEGTLKLNGKPCTRSVTENGLYYGGIGEYVAEKLKPHLPHDIRVNVLGHIQRGGTPVAWDRLLASAFGIHAVDLIAQKNFGQMVGWRAQNVTHVPIETATKPYAFVQETSIFLKTAENLGIYVGDHKK